MKLTINEGLTTLKTLKARYAELVALRDRNSETETRFYGRDTATKEVIKEPTYDVKKLDKTVTSVAKQVRLLENAIKRANSQTEIADYEWSEDALGTVE